MEHLCDHMDIDVSTVIEGRESIEDAGERIFRKILAVASGEVTKAEVSGYNKAMDIYMEGPVI